MGLILQSRRYASTILQLKWSLQASSPCLDGAKYVPESIVRSSSLKERISFIGLTYHRVISRDNVTLQSGCHE